jgi:hypothetical protein
VERLIARRASAKASRKFSEADRLQRRILRMGVRLDDRQRTWSVVPTWQQMQDELREADEQNGRLQQVLQQQLEERIRTLFEYWDSDGNGLIDRAEFRLVMQVLAIPPLSEIPP